MSLLRGSQPKKFQPISHHQATLVKHIGNSKPHLKIPGRISVVNSECVACRVQGSKSPGLAQLHSLGFIPTIGDWLLVSTVFHQRLVAFFSWIGNKHEIESFTIGLEDPSIHLLVVNAVERRMTTAHPAHMG